jgi:archaemetzincin
MRAIRLVAVGSVERRLFDAVRGNLARAFGVRCRAVSSPLDPSFAYHPERGQYHSSEILDRLSRLDGNGGVIVGVTAADLYIPILTFVFGEAQLGGNCAVVSYYRLRQQFYGLPPDDDLLRERLVKEAIHEAGHICGLTHCDGYECVMASSHSVEWLDLKGTDLCPRCRSAMQDSVTKRKIGRAHV